MTYTSFAYGPAAGPWRDEPDVVLAHEKEARSPMECRLFPERGYCVLFGDGRVKFITEDDFAKAKRKDAHRRAELGWPDFREPATPRD